MRAHRPQIVLISLTFAASAGAGVPRVLCSNIPGAASSIVPGPSGWAYRPGVDISTSMPRAVVSPDGSHWALVAWCKQGGSERLGIVHGTGMTQGGNDLLVRVADASHVAGRTVDEVAPSVGVNDAGQVVYAGSLTGTTIDDAFLVRWSGGTRTEIAREGQQVPGMSSGVVFGAAVDSANITGSGGAVFRATLGGSGSGQVWLRSSSATSGVVLAQSGVTSPGSQPMSPSQTISSFVFDQCVGDMASSSTLVRAKLNGPAATDQVAVYGNTVVAQEGAVLPGSAFTSLVSLLTPQGWGVSISPDGSRWAVLGSNADNEDWVVVDGVVVATTDDVVAPGESITFDDTSYSACFESVGVNNLGQVALASRTSTGGDAVVLVGERVLLRTGDGVDLNGNGVPDDNLFVGNVGEGSVTFTEDQRLFAVVQLVDGTTAVRGVALVVLDATRCNDVDFNNDMLFPDTQDIGDFLSVFAGAACPTGVCDDVDFNRDGLFPDTDDLAAFLVVFAGGACP